MQKIKKGFILLMVLGMMFFSGTTVLALEGDLLEEEIIEEENFVEEVPEEAVDEEESLEEEFDEKDTEELEDEGEDKEVYLGDLSGNGAVNVGDVIAMLRGVVGLDFLEDNIDVWQRADVNLDGVVNIGDAVSVLRYITGLLEDFVPVEEAKVSTQKALGHALRFSNVKSVDLERDIVIDEDMNIEGDNDSGEAVVIKGEGKIFISKSNVSINNINIEVEVTKGEGANVNIGKGVMIRDQILEEDSREEPEEKEDEADDDHLDPDAPKEEKDGLDGDDLDADKPEEDDEKAIEEGDEETELPDELEKDDYEEPEM